MKKTLRILFLHEVGYFEKPIFEMHEIPEHLANRGHEIGFFDYVENTSRAPGFKFAEAREGRVVPGVTLQIFHMKAHFSGVLGRLLAVVMFPTKFRAVMSQFQPDVVVCFSVPTSGWQALLISRRLGIPFLFRALDVSHKIRKTVFARFVLMAERFIYRNAAWVSCNNPAMRDYCISLGAAEETTSVELPPLDMSQFANGSGKTTSVLRALNIPETETVLIYLGSFFYFSGLDQVIQDLSLLQNKPTLVLVGGGEQEAQLRDEVRILGLEDKVIFTGIVEFSQLYEYLSIASVAINPMVPALVSNTALPNKVLQYMASGLPVVSTKLRGLESLFFNLEGLGLVNQPREVLRAALKMASLPDRAKLGEENRRVVERQFAVARSVEAFESLILKLGMKS